MIHPQKEAIGFPRLQIFIALLACHSCLCVVSSTVVRADDLAKLQQMITDEASQDEVPIDEYDREHWAYQRIVQPNIPTFANEVEPEIAGWPSNAIDSFLLRGMLDAGLQPAPATDRVTLIRRLSFDLTGLPPSLEELDRFEGDSRPNAYERLLDRMLAAPEYGQRWAQYWLDLARFAETDGYEHDKIRETAWQYRDWVIQALNDDMPYDQFVHWQIAGDLMEPSNPAAKIATAFCLSGPDMPDINSQEERKHVLLNEITSTVGAVFLSLQVGCAQCHDHKYDAISQADFYRLRAFFEPAIALKANQSVATLASFPLKDPMRMYQRGDWRRPGAVVEPAFPRVANLNALGLSVDRNPEERRLELATWMTDPSNPLVARSLVNRVWQFHFGKGLSSTPSDFGLVGQEPTHPELMDYLASKLLEGDWSLKRLHREILRSSFYQMTSRVLGDEQQRVAWRNSLKVDPKNRYWSRFPRRRLDAESIRDAMLAVSGLLNTEVDGPGVRPPLPAELVKTLKNGQWKVSEKTSDHYRRSIYIFARRNLTYPLFATFDRPAANCTCAERVDSTTPLQSLSLLNSDFTRELVESVRRLQQNARARNDHPAVGSVSPISQIFQRVLQRPPTELELQGLEQALQGASHPDKSGSDSEGAEQALADCCVALLNSNLFLYVD